MKIYLAQFLAVILVSATTHAGSSNTATNSCRASNSNILDIVGDDTSFWIQANVRLNSADRNSLGRHAFVSEYSTKGNKRGLFFGMDQGAPAVIWSRDGTKSTFIARGKRFSASELRTTMRVEVSFDRSRPSFTFYVNGNFHGTVVVPAERLPIYGSDAQEMIGCVSRSTTSPDQRFPGQVINVQSYGNPYDDGSYEDGCCGASEGNCNSSYCNGGYYNDGNCGTGSYCYGNYNGNCSSGYCNGNYNGSNGYVDCGSYGNGYYGDGACGNGSYNYGNSNCGYNGNYYNCGSYSNTNYGNNGYDNYGSNGSVNGYGNYNNYLNCLHSNGRNSSRNCSGWLN